MNTSNTSPTGMPLQSILHIRIDPAKVYLYSRPPKTHLYYKTVKWLGHPRKAKRMLRPLRILSKPLLQAGDWDLTATPLEASSAYQRIYDLYENHHDFRSSQTYRKAVESISAGIPYTYKKIHVSSIEELDRFFDEYLMDLINSMRENGYVDSKGSGPCYVLVSRDGNLIKGAKGRHRFAAARITETKSIPVNISHIHKEFARKHDLPTNRPIDREWLATVVKKIEVMNS